MAHTNFWGTFLTFLISILRSENCFDVSVSNVNKDARATQKSRERYRFCNAFSGPDENRLWTKTGCAGIYIYIYSESKPS